VVLIPAPARVVDRAAGWLGAAFLLTLLGSEAVLSLPDEHAGAATVADFYVAHRPAVIALQLVGFVAAGLLALFAWRLRAVSRGVGVAGLVLAVTALAPGSVTLLLALTADPRRLASADAYNRLEPRGDDLLFVGITQFALVVVVLLGRRPRWLGALAGLVALCCLLRLALEALGRGRGALDTLAPVSFLALVAGLAFLCFRGFPAKGPQTSGQASVNYG
jgi:hypothetical protein